MSVRAQPTLSAQSSAFLSSLAADNRRDWFEANKATYEAALKRPAEAFAAAMAAELRSLTGLAHRPKIYRIHRDVRFSKDKTPYNAHLHISFAPQAGGAQAPAWMFGLTPRDLTLGVGVFGFDGAGLDLWRERVDGPDGAALAAALADLEARGVRLNEPDLKRTPKPYPADHPRAHLLRRKGLTAWIDGLDPAVAYGDGGARSCAAALSRLRPAFNWLLALESA